MHTIKNNNSFYDKTIYDYLLQQEKWELGNLEYYIKHMQDLQTSRSEIANYEKIYMIRKKAVYNKTFNPIIKYKDDLNKSILKVKIKELEEEYNRNNRLISVIFNKCIKIDYTRRYRPIVTKI